MKYLQDSFNSPANSEEYRNNWDRIFGDKKNAAKDGGKREPDTKDVEIDPELKKILAGDSAVEDTDPM